MSAHPSAAVIASAQSSTSSGDFLAVAGVISPTADLAGLTFVRRLDSVVHQPALIPGDYSIRLLGAQNNILADYAFTPTPMDDNNGLSFGQVVNFVAGTRSLQIVKTTGGQILISLAVSANPPLVSNVALQEATTPVTGTVTLNWNASDPDNDPLTFDIAYSRDNGATFQPVMINVTGNSAQIDTAQLGGSGSAILRVTASDGVNSASANSVPFVMANKLPQPYLLTPGNNTQIHFGQLVNFSGMALDAQDGVVGDSGLVWKNARGETLGNGALLSLDNLPVGSNVITLVATNSVGESASASITVLVDDDLNLPGPTLTAGPSPITWHVASGTTQTQTADVTINNAGSGALEWQASSDQPWLTLNAASGTVANDGDPATLTLSANPTDLADAATHLAHVTIVTPASANTLTQTVTIPVSLSIGDVWTVPAQTESSSANQAVYLPIVVR